MTARGPGFDMSEMIRKLAAEVLRADGAGEHGRCGQRCGAGLGDGSHGVLPLVILFHDM